MEINAISSSKIKTNQMCEFKFFIEYHNKIKIKTTFAAEQGTLVHLILQRFGNAIKSNVKNASIKRKWILCLLRAYRKGLWKLSKKALQKKKDCKNCEYFNSGICFLTNQNIEQFDGCPRVEFAGGITLVETVINDTGADNPLNKKIIDVENNFNIEIGEEKIPVRGIIDLAVEIDKDTLEIIDYKSGSWIQTPEQCKEDPQLLLYHLAARKIYPQYKNILVTIYYLQGNPITLAFSKEDEILTESSISYYWNSIQHNIFPRRRCDRSNGEIKFDWKCNGLCDPELCTEMYDKFIDSGGNIDLFKILDKKDEQQNTT